MDLIYIKVKSKMELFFQKADFMKLENDPVCSRIALIST